jgi:alkyl sulfatase BDS1-like metallo-beta-lactamase superfamily hydrolase
MGNVSEVAEQMLSGDASVEKRHPFAALHELEELERGVAFASSFANVTAFDTDDGLVLVDTGSFFFASQVHGHVRQWSRRPLHTAIWTHGHVDHVFGVPLYEEEARTNRWPAPRVLAHEALPARFDRYRRTAGFNAAINARQFRNPGLTWPKTDRYPDATYVSRLDVEIGGVAFELHHGRGETDDHTWVWMPARKVLCTGDLFIWATPNAGNPQKVQRYPLDWAQALRVMSTLGAEILCPGHGFPIRGAERVRRALDETAEVLESLHDQTLALMNTGASLDDILHTVRAPAHLLERPYLKPVYDEPEFIVRNVWRLYGGWYDGNPANLKPAPDAAVAAEVAALAGGASRLIERAEALAATGNFRLACHLAEFALRAAPDDAHIAAARGRVYQQRAARERSLMARSIYLAAAEHPATTKSPTAR